MTICEQCGSRNPESAATCYSCGAPLNGRDEGQPTIIDISGNQTEIVTENDRERVGPFVGNAQFGPARIYQVRGGNRSCLIVAVATLLVVCCVCVGWWSVADNIFF